MKRFVLVLLLALVASSTLADGLIGGYPRACKDNTLRLPDYLTSWGAVQRAPCHWTVILPDAGRTWVLSSPSRIPLTITPLDDNCEFDYASQAAPKRPSWLVTAEITVLEPCQFEVSLDTGYPLRWLFNLYEL